MVLNAKLYTLLRHVQSKNVSIDPASVEVMDSTLIRSRSRSSRFHSFSISDQGSIQICPYAEKHMCILHFTNSLLTCTNLDIRYIVYIHQYMYSIYGIQYTVINRSNNSMASHAKCRVPSTSTSEFYTFVLSALHHSWRACDFRSPKFSPAFSMRWRYPIVVFRRTSVSSFNLARSSPVTCCSWCRNFRDGTLKDSQIWGQDSRPLPRPFRRPPQFESRCRASSLARLLLQQSDALLKCIHDRKGLREMAWYLYAESLLALDHTNLEKLEKTRVRYGQ